MSSHWIETCCLNNIILMGQKQNFGKELNVEKWLQLTLTHAGSSDLLCRAIVCRRPAASTSHVNILPIMEQINLIN